MPWTKDKPEWVGSYADTPVQCSCFMCQNGKGVVPTRQELMSDADFEEQVEQVNDPR